VPGSGNVLIDAIAGVGWLSRGGDRNITYFFDNSLGFHNWTTIEKAAFRGALQQFANVANITITEVMSPAGADLQERWVSNAYMLATEGDFAGFHQYPKNPPPAIGAYNFDGRSYFGDSGLSVIGYGFQIFMHEIGHGLGLAHPHDTDMGTLKLPGVISSSDLGTLSYNQNLYTIMSYNVGPSMSPGSNDFGHAGTLMAFDIAAMQFLYGANNNYRTGNDTYELPGFNATGTYWQCIWDAGGTDTISSSSALNATIDLRPASLVNGDPNAGGGVSQVIGIFGGFTIAKGVVIENAITGSGNDTLFGNLADNLLNGGGGDDTAVFSGNRASYAVQNLGNGFRVFGPDGTDTLLSIEHAQFADATLNLNAATVSDPLWSLAGAGDLTGGGTSDIIWYSAAMGRIDLWKISNGQWAGSADPGFHPRGWQPTAFGDLNGDGTGDVVWYNSSTGNIDLWKIVNGQWAGSVNIGSHPLGWQLAGSGDLNGDGTGDLIWFNPSTGNVDLWKIANGQWAGSVNIGSHPLGYQIAGLGDFDHDGTSDVLWYNASNGATEIWKIVNGQWGGSLDLGSHPMGWVPIGTGDFNHDGTSDIAWYNATTRNIDIWQIVNGKWSGSSDVGSHPAGWAAARVGDFNGDGSSDIAWYNAATGNVDIWKIANAHWAGSADVGLHPL
jgi:hypothetical protein